MGLTLAVQIGFVVGAVVASIFSIAHVFPARRVFVVSGVVGAIANVALVGFGPGSTSVALALRLFTGIALAGVYPSGMKVMAGWFERRRGMALGVLVGALTIGSAGPHLVRSFGLEWQGVLVAAWMLAVLGVVVIGPGLARIGARS